MIEKFICKKNDTLIQVIKVINENAKGIAFITDEDDKLVGVITDGDIRRALLNDISLDQPVSSILNKSFIYGSIKESYSDLMNKISRKINIIPLVDDEGKVVDLFEYKQNIYFPVAIPNLTGNEFKYLTDAFLSTWISSRGKYIEDFEHMFAEYTGSKYGVAVSNGTVALHLALAALGIKEGDEVIVPDFTFAATINAVIHANATPVIVDIDEQSWCMDPVKIEKAITKKTRALIPVHVYGQPCDMNAIMDIADKYGLYVIEDCAEAHGASFQGKRVGSFGHISCFSFYGNKVITTGEGGMCVTDDPQLNEKMRILRDHGMSKTKRYWHDYVGFNYRMTNLQAAIGLAQLERINEILANRKNYELQYKKILNKSMFQFQTDLPDRDRITWLVCVMVNDEMKRDEVMATMNKYGIDARPFFYPLSDMPVYHQYVREHTNITHKIAYRGLNLPTYESLKPLSDIKEALVRIKF